MNAQMMQATTFTFRIGTYYPCSPAVCTGACPHYPCTRAVLTSKTTPVLNTRVHGP